MRKRYQVKYGAINYDLVKEHNDKLEAAAEELETPKTQILHFMMSKYLIPTIEELFRQKQEVLRTRVEKAVSGSEPVRRLFATLQQIPGVPVEDLLNLDDAQKRVLISALEAVRQLRQRNAATDGKEPA